MKRVFSVFLVFWIGLFLLTFFTAKDLTILQRIGYTAAMAVFAALMALFGTENRKTSYNKSSGRTRVIEVRNPNSPKVLYRVKRNKIYRNMEPAPIYEMKGNKVFLMNSPKVVYILEENKVYRNMAPVPILEIKGNKVCKPLSPKVVYELFVKYE